MSKSSHQPLELWFTLGPTSLGKEREIILAGATGVRLTFGFGTPSIHHERAILLKKIAREVGQTCLTIADLNGEKFRLGRFEGPATISVSAGAKVRLVKAEVTSPSAADVSLPIPDETFFSYLREGSIVTIGDGAILRVNSISADQAGAEMLQNGLINHARGLNIQGKEFQPRSLTEKDLADLDHILSSSVYDIVALSFAGSEKDVSKVKARAREANSQIRVLAKIETAAGLENLEEICQSADFVMAARGDLALSIPWVELPNAVSRIASIASSTGTPWILATQIVEGLERFAMPTRAEICDLSQWVCLGCAGVLLSTESAFGSRPIEAVSYTSTMLREFKGNSGRTLTNGIY